MTAEKRKHEKRLIRSALLMMILGLLTGCGQLEIEDRAFPLALAITPAKTDGYYEFQFLFEEMDTEGSSLYHKEDAVVTATGYPQAFTMFGRVQAAGLDDSHMQVILLSEKLLDDESFLESFYGYFQKEHHFSWNTMVYLLDEDSVSPEDLRESTDNRTGTYLREMAQSDEQEKTAGVPTLGDLYKEWNNHETILLFPVLSGSTPPSVDHYRMLVQGKAGDTLSMDEARLLQFLRGDLKSMQLELSDGTILGISHIRRCCTSTDSDSGKKVTIRAACEVQNRVGLSEAAREQSIRAATRILNEKTELVREWAFVKDATGQPVLPEYEILLSRKE